MVYEKLELMDGFTATERNVADFILAHAEQVSTMSAATLAEAAYCSPATIVRLCRKVGTNGYRQFCVDLAADLQRRETMGSQCIDINRPFAPEQSPQDVIERVSRLTHKAIDLCRAEINPTHLELCARALRRARSVFVYAAGDSQISATGFANLLLKLGIHCIMAGTYSEEIATTMTAMPGDVGLVVSYSGRLLRREDLRECLGILKRNHCRTILVSSIPSAPAFDYHFHIPPLEEQLDTIATFYSQTCIRLVLHCLYAETYAVDYCSSRHYKEEIDHLNDSIRP